MSDTNPINPTLQECEDAINNWLPDDKIFAEACEKNFPDTFEAETVAARAKVYFVEYTWSYRWHQLTKWFSESD